MSPHTAEQSPTTDQTWFAGRVEGLLPELYGAAVRLCRDRTEAEDLVADAVARAWEALPSLKERDAFRAWIFRILNNRFVSHCRSARARESEPEAGAPDEASFSIFERLHHPVLLWWGNPKTEFLNGLLREDLERALDALPDAFRAVVVLVDVEGFPYREVAELLEVPVGTVRSRLSRGRSLMQATLWEHAIEAGLTRGPAPNQESEDGNER